MSEQEKMRDFVVTARKWRPLNFSSVVGQEHITQTLKNAVLSERVHHAYLFSGPRGVGKTTCARILSRAVNCLHPVDAEPCNECENCRGALDGRSLDVIEIDGASNNSVDDVRKLRENAKYPPSLGRYKMYIIDEVHMLSGSAFNALLKTLEEPPPHLLFIFATTESHKVPATILSRCQRFEFRSMEIDSIVGRLKLIAETEGITIDEDSLQTIAQKADGSMRDSQSIFDQAVAFCGKDVRYSELSDALHLVDREFYFRISDAIISKNISEIFEISRAVTHKGYDLQECLSGLLEHFRNALSVKISGGTKYVDMKNSFTARYADVAAMLSKTDLLRILQLLGNTEQALRFAHRPKLKFEMALVQLASMDSAIDTAALISAVKEIKEKGFTAAPAPIAVQQSAAPAEKIEKTTLPPLTLPAKKEAPAMPANPFAPSENAKIETPAPPSPPPAIETPKPAPAEPGERKTLEKHWDEFVAIYSKPDKGLQPLSKPDDFRPSFSGGKVIFTVDSEFLAGLLTKAGSRLSAALKEFFGAGTGYEIEIMSSAPVIANAPAQSFAPPEQKKPAEAAPKSKEKRMEGKSEMEKKIIDLFDALEI